MTSGEPPLLCALPRGNSTSVDVLRDPRAHPRWPAAHRGDRDSGPDNSATAFEAATRAGVPLLETDVRITTDGALFLFHDHTLKKTNVTGPPSLLGRDVSSLSSEEVRLLQSNFPPNNPPSPVLFLDDALRILSRSRSALLLDLKGESLATVQRIVSLARDRGVAAQLVIQCQSISELSRAREAFPDIAVLARVRTPAEVDQALEHDPEIVFSDFNFFSSELIARIHARGSKVGEKAMGFDLDTVENWTARFNAGVDILMTDHGVSLLRFTEREICGSRPSTH